MGFGLVLVGAARSSPTPALTRRTDAGSFFKIVLVKIAGFDPRAIRRKISPIPGLPATHMGWISAQTPGTWALSAHRRQVSIVVALVISGVAKWLARGFEDSKIRVAFEADMVAKGMSPQEAGKAWLKAYTGQAVDEGDRGDQDAA